MNITVKTKTCSGCDSGPAEHGLQLQLTGLLGLAECTTDNLDNPDKQDYSNGATSSFDNKNGIGACGVSFLVGNI
jgi:hypothetical protein